MSRVLDPANRMTIDARTQVIGWLRRKWREITTQACPECGAENAVVDYRATGATHKGSWWAAGGAELECPVCGFRFWVKR